MKTNTKIIVIVSAIALLIAVGLFFFIRNRNKVEIVGNDKDIYGCISSAGYSWCEATSSCLRPWENFCTSATPKTVTFECDLEKNIIATFYPTDDNFVDLVLSDDRKISIPRAISASGARYANPDESLVFWNKGDTAFITEEDPNNPTFKNCVLQTSVNAEIKQNVENYLRENISKLSPTKAVLGGTWYVVSVTTDVEENSGTVTYEDGHVQEIRDFSYTINNKGEVVSLTIFPTLEK